MAKVAVVSTDGVSIDEHFGRAERFLIYEADETGHSLLEIRDANAYAAHGAGYSKPRLLADVEAVLAVRIGAAAEAELRSYGVAALPVSGPIEAALQKYGQRRKYLHLASGSACGGCSGCSR
ncbi:MAG: NifB/NifX family molybdenum-iron cluster-binding protein [Sporomusaceae bacterium]|nr:NifB/NifX family molybdenum-iron cluster-binding protein [Sporomusaceae bacterium]